MVAETASRPPGLVAEGIVGIAARFGGMAHDGQEMSAVERKARLYRELHQTPIAPPQIPINAGAGILIPTDVSGPMTGQYWSIRRLVSYGYTAGTVAVLRNGVQTAFGAAPAAVGENLFQFPQAGTYTFGRGEILLRPDDSLLFTATSITLAAGQPGIQLYGDADVFPAWLLPDYIM